MIVAACADRNRYALHDASVVMASRIHPIVNGKVPAYQVSSHRSILLGKRLGRIIRVGLIFAIVHSDNTPVSGGRAVGAIMWTRPMTAFTEACRPFISPLRIHELCFLHWRDLAVCP